MKSGIYFIRDEAEIVYIGRSKNVDARIRHHPEAKRIAKARLSFDVVYMDTEKAERMEREWIALLNPRNNIRLLSPEVRKVRPPSRNYSCAHCDSKFARKEYFAHLKGLPK